MRNVWALALVMTGALSTAAAAQEQATPLPAVAPAAVQPAAPIQGHVAAGSVVSLELAEPLSSKIHPRGHRFAIRLAEPVMSAEGVLIPAGTEGVGEVISSSKAGMMGKAGELLLAARYLAYNGQQIPLRTFRLGDAGTDNTATVLMVGMVVPLAFVIKGGDIQIPAGTRANAKLTADLTLPVAPAAATAAAAAQAPASSTPTNQEPVS